MADKSPGVGERPFEAALEAARQAVGRRSPGELAARSGGAAMGGGIALGYFGRTFTVLLPGLMVTPELPEMERVLLLHYLASEGEVPEPGDWVSFHHLPGGSFYESAYRRRGTARILAVFGRDSERLVSAGLLAGGTPAELGDVSVIMPAFPRVHAAVVLHRGDDEFPAEAGVLFRRNITAFFSLEDVAVLAGVIASRLLKAARSPS